MWPERRRKCPRKSFRFSSGIPLIFPREIQQRARGWKKPSRFSSKTVLPPSFLRPWLTSTPFSLSLSFSFSRRRLRNERASRARKNHPTVLASIIPRFLAQRGGKQRTREHWRTASTAVLRNCFLSSFSAGEIFGFEEKSRNFPLSWKQERISSGGGSDSRGMNGSPKTFGEMPEGAARLCQILGKVSAEFSGL